MLLEGHRHNHRLRRSPVGHNAEIIIRPVPDSTLAGPGTKHLTKPEDMEMSGLSVAHSFNISSTLAADDAPTQRQAPGLTRPVSASDVLADQRTYEDRRGGIFFSYNTKKNIKGHKNARNTIIKLNKRQAVANFPTRWGVTADSCMCRRVASG